MLTTIVNPAEAVPTAPRTSRNHNAEAVFLRFMENIMAYTGYKCLHTWYNPQARILKMSPLLLQRLSVRIRSLLAEYWPLLVLLSFFSYLMLSTMSGSINSNFLTAWNYGYFSGLAFNTLKYGLIATKFHSAWTTTASGGIDTWYISYPPLLTLLLAASLGILMPLGFSQEFAAGLVPSVFSLGSLTFLYLLANRLWGRRVAIVATFVMPFTPMFRSYGQLICFETLATFFILGMLYSYVMWLEYGRKSHYRLMCCFFVIGSYTAWPAYYLNLLLICHYALFRGFRGFSKMIVLGVLGVVMASVYLVHCYWVLGDETYDRLILRMTYKSGSVPNREPYNQRVQMFFESFSDMSPDKLAIYPRLSNVRVANTSYLLYASFLFLGGFAFNIYRRRDVRKESYVLLLLLVASVENLLWTEALLYETFWSYYFTPGLVLASVLAVDNTIRGDREYREFMLWLILLVLWFASFSPDQFGPGGFSNNPEWLWS
jgi:hypothetical protein